MRMNPACCCGDRTFYFKYFIWSQPSIMLPEGMEDIEENYVGTFTIKLGKMAFKTNRQMDGTVSSIDFHTYPLVNSIGNGDYEIILETHPYTGFVSPYELAGDSVYVYSDGIDEFAYIFLRYFDNVSASDPLAQKCMLYKVNTRTQEKIYSVDLNTQLTKGQLFPIYSFSIDSGGLEYYPFEPLPWILVGGTGQNTAVAFPHMFLCKDRIYISDLNQGVSGFLGSLPNTASFRFPTDFINNLNDSRSGFPAVKNVPYIFIEIEASTGFVLNEVYNYNKADVNFEPYFVWGQLIHDKDNIVGMKHFGSSDPNGIYTSHLVSGKLAVLNNELFITDYFLIKEIQYQNNTNIQSAQFQLFWGQDVEEHTYVLFIHNTQQTGNHNKRYHLFNNGNLITDATYLIGSHNYSRHHWLIPTLLDGYFLVSASSSLEPVEDRRLFVNYYNSSNVTLNNFEYPDPDLVGAWQAHISVNDRYFHLGHIDLEISFTEEQVLLDSEEKYSLYAINPEFDFDNVLWFEVPIAYGHHINLITGDGVPHVRTTDPTLVFWFNDENDELYPFFEDKIVYSSYSFHTWVNFDDLNFIRISDLPNEYF